MAAARPPRRRPPPLSPSHSLFGLEKSVPPNVPSPGQYSLSPYDTSSQSKSLLQSPLNRPLPHQPKRSSSIYSSDSGYTKIIQSYGEWEKDSPLPIPVMLQPRAYRDIVAGLLGMRFSEAQSLESGPNIPRGHDQTLPSFRLASDVSPPLATVSSKKAPSFAEFSRHIRVKRTDLVSPMSFTSPQNLRGQSCDKISPKISTVFPPISFGHESQSTSHSISNHASEMTEFEPMPPYLDLSRSSKVATAEAREVLRQQQESNLAAPNNSETGAQTHKSINKNKVYRLSQDSFSDDSFTVYNDAREVVRAMIKEKVRKKKESRREKRVENELKEPTSFVKAKHPGMTKSDSSKPVTQSAERQFSWVSSRWPSMQQGVDNLRTLSIRGRAPEEDRGRTMVRGHSHRRQKQRTISMTPYQRYWPDIWLAKNKRKREKVLAARKAATDVEAQAQVLGGDIGLEHHTSGAAQHYRGSKAGEFAVALQNGRSQLLHVLDGLKGKRSASRRQRERIKKSITLVGLTVIDAGNAEGGWV
jgi:hypothetical protein